MKLKDILSIVFDLMEKISEVQPESVVPTGFQEIDVLTGGLKPGELILVLTGEEELSRVLAQNIIINLIQDQLDLSILVFSSDISKEQYTMQLLSIKSQVDYSSISLAKPTLKQTDWDKISMATEDLSKSNIQIIDQNGLTIEQLQAQIEEANKNELLNLIVIDNIESLLVETGNHEFAAFKSKCTESGEFKHFIQTELWEDDYKASRLKTMSEALNIPIVVVSDNNMGSAGKKIPKQYSMIEWADLVFEMDDEWKRGYVGAVDINITKNKCGLTGKIGLYYTEECFRFNSYNSEPDDH
jgi:replicative DNA helicase